MSDGNDRPGGPARVRTLEAELELAGEFARRLERAAAGVPFAVVLFGSRARRSLSSSRILLDHGDNDFTVARACFAMFYAASAVLLAFEDRRDGDYGNRFPSREAVEARIAEAAGFVGSSASLLEGRGIDLREPVQGGSAVE